MKKKFIVFLSGLFVVTGCASTRPVFRPEQTGFQETRATEIIGADQSKANSDGEGPEQNALKDSSLTTGKQNSDSKETSESKAIEPGSATVAPGEATSGNGTSADLTSPQDPLAGESQTQSGTDGMAGSSSSESSAASAGAAGARKSVHSLNAYLALKANRVLNYKVDGKVLKYFPQFLTVKGDYVRAQLGANVINKFNEDKAILEYKDDVFVLEANSEFAGIEGINEPVSRRENYLSIPLENQKVILKAPLEVGHTWESQGSTFKILAVDEPMEVDSKMVDSLIVEEKSENGVLKQTYAVGFGLVSSKIVQGQGREMVLDSVKENSSESVESTFLFLEKDPNGLPVLKEVKRTLQFSSNRSPKDLINEVYFPLSRELGKEPILTEEAKINYIYVEKNSRGNVAHIDLNSAFVNSMEGKNRKVEQAVIQALVNTVCQFYNISSAKISIEDQRYESKNFTMQGDSIWGIY